MKNLSLILAIFFASSFAIMAQLNNNPNNNTGGLRDNSNAGRGGEHRPGSHDNHGNNHNGNGNWNNNNNNGNWTNHNGHNHGNGNGNGNWNGNNNNGHHHGNGHNHGNGNWNNNNGHNHNGHHHYNSYCSYQGHGFNWVSVHVDIFNSNCYNIRNFSFESERLQAAKHFANNNHLSTAQVCDLMGMLNYESSRLEFARFAFGRTCDIQNYHLVFNYLNYEASRINLDYYIRGFNF